jgi:hypothetical protein
MSQVLLVRPQCAILVLKKDGTCHTHLKSEKDWLFFHRYLVKRQMKLV